MTRSALLESQWRDPAGDNTSTIQSDRWTGREISVTGTIHPLTWLWRTRTPLNAGPVPCWFSSTSQIEQYSPNLLSPQTQCRSDPGEASVSFGDVCLVKECFLSQVVTVILSYFVYETCEYCHCITTILSHPFVMFSLERLPIVITV